MVKTLSDLRHLEGPGDCHCHWRSRFKHRAADVVFDREKLTLLLLLIAFT